MRAVNYLVRAFIGPEYAAADYCNCKSTVFHFRSFGPYIDLLRISTRQWRAFNRQRDALSTPREYCHFAARLRDGRRCASYLRDTSGRSPKRNLSCWAVFVAGALCAVHADGFAYSQSSNHALGSIEIGERAAVNPGNPIPTAVPAGAGNPFLTIPLHMLSATRDRPLFSRSRRPSPAAAGVPSPQQLIPVIKPAVPEAPPLALLGTIVGDTSRIGVFLNETLQTAQTIREGEGASGWTLLSLHPRSAVLVRDGQIVTLEFPALGSTAGAPIEAASGGIAGPVPGVSGYLRKQGWPALP